MSAPDLRLVGRSGDPAASDLATVGRHATVLADLTARAEQFTTKEQVRRLEEAISAAKAATKSVNLPAAAAEMARGAQPATLPEIKRQLQVLIGSFPNASKADLAIFGVALLEDVVAEQPGISVITNACRKLRRSSRFVPTISEVLEALAAENQQHQSLLADVRGFADCVVRAEAAALAARERVDLSFERSVRFCIARIQCEKSVDFFGQDVLGEARRRIGPEIDEATCAANRERLAALAKPFQTMPTKDSGWNP